MSVEMGIAEMVGEAGGFGVLGGATGSGVTTCASCLSDFSDLGQQQLCLHIKP